jgi:hypothetical protein
MKTAAAPKSEWARERVHDSLPVSPVLVDVALAAQADAVPAILPLVEAVALLAQGPEPARARAQKKVPAQLHAVPQPCGSSSLAARAGRPSS